MALQAGNLAGLVATTLSELGRLKMTDLMSDYQRTIVLKRLVKKNKMTFDSGKSISFNVVTGHNESARFVGLYATDVVDVLDNQTTGDVPWRHITWNWAFDRREKTMNSGASKIVDLIKSRRVQAFGSAIEKFEQRAWRVPAAADDVNPYGIPYWVVKSNTAVTTNDGFNGTAPSGYTTVGGISPTTYQRWRNYAAQYTSVTKDDLVRKMRRAMEYTDFESLTGDFETYNVGDDYGVYTNYAVLGTFEEILEANNDNLGTDLAPMDGKVMFRGQPVQFVKELDNDTTNPVYGINWGVFGTVGLRGEWMRETVDERVAGQHTVAATHTDCSFNWVCYDRRRNWVLATDTTLPA